VWGPYTEARLAVFAAEGRIVAATLVSPWSAGPFSPADRMPEFAALLKSAAPPQPPPARIPPAAIPEEAEGTTAPARAVGGAARPLLVWTFLASLPVAAFEAALGGYGPCVAIRPGLWLVQARMGPASLRNALSRRLRADDTLLVVEAPLEQAAWFNLSQVSEHELRRLWIA
jgi:hypothetical protein